MKKEWLLTLCIILSSIFSGCNINDVKSCILPQLKNEKIAEISIKLNDKEKVLNKNANKIQIIELLNAIKLERIENPKLAGISYVLLIKTESGQVHKFWFRHTYFTYEITDKDGKNVQTNFYKTTGTEIDIIGNLYEDL